MVNLQDIFKEYERYKKNPKEKNKKRLITSLFILFRSNVKVIESCETCEHSDETHIVEKPLFCRAIKDYIDERGRLVNYIPEGCPYKTFEHYLKIMDELREPGELLGEEKK